MKPTESHEQLLERFQKRIYQLQERKRELEEYVEEDRMLDIQLSRLEGSIQAVEYLAYGKLPGDGNHGGMADHNPR